VAGRGEKKKEGGILTTRSSLHRGRKKEKGKRERGGGVGEASRFYPLGVKRKKERKKRMSAVFPGISFGMEKKALPDPI